MLCNMLHRYIAETDISCSIHHYIINCNQVQNILYMFTLLLYTYIDNTYIICSITVICYISHIYKYIDGYVLLQHGYIVLKDNYTICCTTRYITII